MARDPRADAEADRLDRICMARLVAGDHGGFDELWHRYRQPLFTFLLRRTGAPAAAEDALQQTFVRLFRFRHRYDPDRPLRRWLYTIAANVGRDAWSTETGHWSPLPDDLVGGSDPERGAHARDVLAKALHALDAVDRRVLLLTIEGFTSAEIGEMTRMNQNTVRIRLKRARAKMHAALPHGGGR